MALPANYTTGQQFTAAAEDAVETQVNANTTAIAGDVPWSGGTVGKLPATSGQHLTTQGGNTLDDGSGNVAIIGGTLDGVTIGATAPSIIQNRRNTSANWASSNPVPAQGEVVFITDTQDFKLGDGTRNFNNIAGWKARHTLGASFRPLRGTTSAISSSVLSGTVTTGVGSIIGWASAYPGSYRFLGMIPGASAAGSTWCQNNNNSGITTPSVNPLYSPITVEFWSNATAISVYFSASTQPDMWAIVDDERIQDGWQHANYSTGPVTWQLTQTSGVWRKYRLCMGFSSFQGIAINSGASIVPTAPGFQVAVVGDSYVSGGVFEANAITPGVSGTIAAGTLIGELEQITGLEIWRFGIGGTGYVSTAGYTGGNYGSTQRVGYFAGLTNKFHACLIYGGINDWTLSTSTVVAAAQAAWTAWAAAHPELPPLIVTGFQAGGTPSAYTGGANATNAALKTAALASPNVGTFIDLLANPYVFGTGYDGSPVGDGNRDVFISSDSAHPTHIGWRAAGADLVQKLSQVVLQNTVGV